MGKWQRRERAQRLVKESWLVVPAREKAPGGGCQSGCGCDADGAGDWQWYWYWYRYRQLWLGRVYSGDWVVWVVPGRRVSSGSKSGISLGPAAPKREQQTENGDGRGAGQSYRSVYSAGHPVTVAYSIIEGDSPAASVHTPPTEKGHHRARPLASS